MAKPQKTSAGPRRGKPKTTKAGRKILAGLDEAAAYMRGEHVPGIVVHKPAGLARRAKPFDKEAFRALLKRKGGETPSPDDAAPGRKRA